MCWCSDMTEKTIKLSHQVIQKDSNNVNHQKFHVIHEVLFSKHEDKVLNKELRHIGGCLRLCDQVIIGLSYEYNESL
jgi:hypothetical protein